MTEIIIALCALALILGCGLLFMVAPACKRKGLDKYKGTLFAHRGYHTEAIPENSLAAFKEAKKQGLPVEFDVQFTKDDKVVVFHDGTLDRMCGVSGKVRDFTYEELKGFKLKGTEEGIPLLSEVLEALDGTLILLELKYYDGLSDCRICEATCKEIEGYKGDIIVESFSPFIVGWFKKHRPDMVRGQLATDRFDKGQSAFNRFMSKNLLLNVISRPHFVAYRYDHENPWGLWICRRIFGVLTFGWTPRSKEATQKALAEFDGAIGENFL